MRSEWLNSRNPALRAAAAAVQTKLKEQMSPEQRVAAVAEIIQPILEDRLVHGDPWGPILGELDWTGVPVGERLFRVPDELVGASEIMTYNNGMTFPQFTYNRRYVGVQADEVAPPEYVVDSRELERADALANIEKAAESVATMFTIYKARTGYDLLAGGFDNGLTGGNVNVIIDDGTYDSFNQLSHLRLLRDTIEDKVQTLQDGFNGRPQIALVARQITLDRLKRAGLSADWDSELPAGNEGPGPAIYRPALKGVTNPFVFPNATDDINGDPNKGRPIFTEGDILLFAPNVGALARTEPLDSSIFHRSHWTFAYAWRTAYAWVRWSNLGDRNKIIRFLVIKPVANGGEQGTITIDRLTADGVAFYSNRPIRKSTVTNTTMVISATSGGAQATGAFTSVTLKGDLRHGVAKFTTPLTPGTNYFITTTAGILDMAGSAMTAMAEAQRIAL